MPLLKYSDQFKDDLLVKFEDYVKSTDCPQLIKFAVLNDIPSSTIYEFTRFADCIKKASDKAMMYRIDQLESGKNIVAMIYLLKAAHKLYDQPSQVQLEGKGSTYTQINVYGKTKEELQDLAQKRLRTTKVESVRKPRK